MENIICLLNSSLFLLVNAFGRIIDSTYSSLADNTVLSSDTTLYCVTENKDTPQVTWSYLNLNGIRTNLPSVTISFSPIQQMLGSVAVLYIRVFSSEDVTVAMS